MTMNTFKKKKEKKKPHLILRKQRFIILFVEYSTQNPTTIKCPTVSIIKYFSQHTRDIVINICVFNH